jgi:hypothetical protein
MPKKPRTAPTPAPKVAVERRAAAPVKAGLDALALLLAPALKVALLTAAEVLFMPVGAGVAEEFASEEDTTDAVGVASAAPG